MNEAREVYEMGMDAECGPGKLGVPPGNVNDLHRKYIAAARTAFTNKRTMATQEEVNKSLNKILTVLFII